MQGQQDVGLDISLPGQCSTDSFAAQIMAPITKERTRCGGEVPTMMLSEAVDCPGDTWTKPTYETLKVCLDDDSSIEDEDEDMFDDDAFTFGDEDFEALMSHESMQRLVRAQISTLSTCGPASPASSTCSPLHRKSSSVGLDSLPSTAPSSSGESARFETRDCPRPLLKFVLLVTHPYCLLTLLLYRDNSLLGKLDSRLSHKLRQCLEKIKVEASSISPLRRESDINTKPDGLPKSCQGALVEFCD